MSSSQFADEIGVQRSSVSHVLTGRNKPGFDFIQKIIGAFPDISAEWLITGIGSMLREEKARSDELFIEQKDIQGSSVERGTAIPEHDMPPASEAGKESDMITSEKRRSIEKIIVIYNDKSFDEYHPQ
ncbi:MAG: helix-turn-helix transcriptional regulator [Bacteroidales bacterium]|nr:helix-turn-helix transcriptional regulator [Bacteroidales bacterium]